VRVGVLQAFEWRSFFARRLTLPFDEDITHLDAHNTFPLDIQGPITRARAPQLNLEVSSFLSTSTYDFENRLLPNNYIVIKNQGEDQEMHGEGLGGMEV
jgi:hypothetical protein